MADLLERHGARFMDRCFREGEVILPAGEDLPEPVHLAGRWAAKEALLKALGTDVRGIPYRDIEIRPSPAGPVGLVLHEKALAAANRSGGRRIHLSISHEREFAIATVLVED